MNESLKKRQRRFETADHVEISPQRIEVIAQELEQRGEFDTTFAQKIQRKIDLKDQLVEDDGTNTYESMKRLGIFIVEEKSFPKEITEILQKNGVDIYPDETVLELHIPPQDIKLEDIAESLVRLEEYLRANERERKLPLYIYGISYLARFAKRYGFELVDLPKALKAGSGAARLLEIYRNSSNPKRRKLAERFTPDDIQLSYLTTDDFFQRIEALPNYKELQATNLIKNLRKRVKNSKVVESS